MNKVFVGSLSWNTEEKGLSDLFSEIGGVEEVRIIRDRETGQSRGFGFVTFGDASAASKAVEKFDGYSLDGRTIKVSIANEKPEGSRGGSFNRNNNRGGSGGGGGGNRGRSTNRW